MDLKLNFYGEARKAIKDAMLARGWCCERLGIYGYTVSEGAIAWVGLNEVKERGGTRIEFNPVVGIVNQTLNTLIYELRGKPQHPLSPLISSSLGYLMPAPHYRKWVFTPGLDIHAIANDLAENIMHYGIPWAQQYSTLEALLPVLRNMAASPGLYDETIPCVLHLLHRNQEAEEYLSQVLAEQSMAEEKATKESWHPSSLVPFEHYRQFAERLRELMKLH